MEREATKLKKFTIKNVLWGFLFIGIATMIICRAAGWLPDFDTVNIWSLLLAALLIPLFVVGCMHLVFSAIFFPMAIWAIIFSEQLGIQKFTPWPVLGAALFLSIGCALLVPRNVKWFKNVWNGDDAFSKHEDSEHWTDETVAGGGDNQLKMNTSFAGSSKYINSQDFRSCDINCSFGGTKVYFDKAVIQGRSATINLKAEFSGVELFVPKEWTVKNMLRTKMGGVEEKGAKDAAKSGKFVVLTGDTSFSGVTIHYC